MPAATVRSKWFRSSRGGPGLRAARGLVAAGLMLAAVLLAPADAARAQDDEEDELPAPGLIATWTHAGQSISHFEARPALRIEPGQAPHPAVGPGPVEGRWRGRLNVLRPGAYRLRAEVVGAVRVRIGDAWVVEAASTNDTPASATGPSVELAYGPAELEVLYKAPSGKAAAQLRLYWQREGDFEEVLVPAVLGHLKADVEDAVRRGAEQDRGRLLAAEQRCTRCHAGDLGLAVDPAPQLDAISTRVRASWLYHWLDNPRAVQPRALMPDLFGEGTDDAVDLAATVAYLAALDLPPPADKPPAAPQSAPADKQAVPQQDPPAVESVDLDAARREFASTGCIACHTALGESRAAFPELRPLDGMASKTTVAGIEARLARPTEHHPASRMPDFRLGETRPETLAALVAYLATSREPRWESQPPRPDDAAARARWRALAADPARAAEADGWQGDELWRRLGRRVTEVRRCNACHEWRDADGPRPLAAPAGVPSWRDVATRSARSAAMAIGCLRASPTATRPGYALDDAERGGLAEFVAASATAPAAAPAAPRFAVEAQLDRLGCTACHERNGRGGTFARRILDFVPLGTDQTIRDVAAPELTAVGEKLRRDALEGVIAGPVRARPWLPLVMPVFPKEHVATLAAELVAAEGLDPRAKLAAPDKPGPEALEAGRLLVGRTGMNCISCHDIRGIKGTGTRGPDLAMVTRRVTPEWFRRWLLDPQRISPGTRMPTVFFGGKSAAPQYLSGDPEAQLAALWGYLALGDALPLPLLGPPQVVVAGGENPRFEPTDRPLIVKGFMPSLAGLRGLALGFPGGPHFAYDTEQCRLAGVWQGDFVQVGGWYGSGRGSTEDNAAKPLADPAWVGPEGPLLDLPTAQPTTAPSVPVKFADPRGIDRPRWLVAAAAKSGAVLEYSLPLGGAEVRVSERPEPLKLPGVVAFRRRVEFTALPVGREVRARLADSLPTDAANAPRAHDAAGKSVAWSATATNQAGGRLPVDAARWVGWSTGPESSLWLSVRAAPAGAVWSREPTPAAANGGAAEGLSIRWTPAADGGTAALELVYVVAGPREAVDVRALEAALGTVPPAAASAPAEAAPAGKSAAEGSP